MSRLPIKTIRAVKTLGWLALLAWAVGSGWYLHQARQAGGRWADTLVSIWPEGGTPRAGSRDVLFGVAQKMRQGRFAAVAADLGPAAPLGKERKAAVTRFFATEPEVCRRFVAAAAAAQRAEEDGADVRLVRRALAPALAGAAKKDVDRVSAGLDLAEAILAKIDLPGGFSSAPSDAQAVHRMIDKVAPAYELGKDLLTEGHPAVEKLLGRAAWHYQRDEFRQAAALVGLASRLLGVEPYAAAEETPQWFAVLADPPTPSITKAESQAVLEYCRAMARAESPAQPVRELVKRAGREFEAERFGPARWWATVALNALGMDDTTWVGTPPADAETPQEETTE